MLIWSRDLTTVTKKNSSHEPSDKWSPINASSSLKKFSLLEKVENFSHFSAVTSSSNFTKEWIKKEQSNTNKNSFRQQNKSSFTTGAKTNRMENRRTFSTTFSPQLCVAHRLSPMQECVLATHITCMFENMSRWRNHTFCFRNHLRCFKVRLTPCVKINESNNNVGRATVFDTKKRCDE